MRDTTFDNSDASVAAPYLSSGAETLENMKEARSTLLDQTGPVALMAHSQSLPLRWVLGDSRPNSIRSIVALEPKKAPFINTIFPPDTPAHPLGVTETPLAYDPPISSPNYLNLVVASNSSLFTYYRQDEPAHKLVNLMKISIFIVTSKTSYRAIYDGCTVDYFKQVGVRVDHINLGDVETNT
ncbi:hypothetical protein AN958_01367 [Leucoagaricus sp. SymC.cos]|nr:hypothetical protein AN958_01367 [Leucoagaricus sp. SymC.cos]